MFYYNFELMYIVTRDRNCPFNSNNHIFQTNPFQNDLLFNLLENVNTVNISIMKFAQKNELETMPTDYITICCKGNVNLFSLGLLNR
jgi:hypothetical protein